MVRMVMMMVSIFDNDFERKRTAPCEMHGDTRNFTGNYDARWPRRLHQALFFSAQCLIGLQCSVSTIVIFSTFSRQIYITLVTQIQKLQRYSSTPECSL
jgi:hypothetical protein